MREPDSRARVLRLLFGAAAFLIVFASTGTGGIEGEETSPPAPAAPLTVPPAVRAPEAPFAPPGADLVEPAWAKGPEDLVFRISYLGVTAGYARFSYRGRVAMEGRDTYHIHVRAWTSSILALVYPLNDVLDYYLDVRTLAPVRQDFKQRERNKNNDDISIYDQEKGTITTRQKFTGKVVKKVSVIPNVHDPVTVVYNFRAMGRWDERCASNVYAGRKLWEISAKKVGVEKIRIEEGEFESILVRPIIRRDGKPESKGDLKLWMSNDARHTPLRIYAKIKLGTLVGELVRKEGGAADAR